MRLQNTQLRLERKETKLKTMKYLASDLLVWVVIVGLARAQNVVSSKGYASKEENGKMN